MCIPFDPANIFSILYPKEQLDKQPRVCHNAVHQVLYFYIRKTLKQPKCPTIREFWENGGDEVQKTGGVSTLEQQRQNGPDTSKWVNLMFRKMNKICFMF